MCILTLKCGINDIDFEIWIYQKIRIHPFGYHRYYVTGIMAPVLTGVTMFY